MPFVLLATIPICHGETMDGLKLDFSRRTVTLEVTVEDLQDAYKILPDGTIKMLARPDATTVNRRQATVQVARGKRKTGILQISVDGRETEVQVASDNSLVGAARTGGLPFGYAFLPPQGKADKGQTWLEEFAPPAESDGPRATATFRYTFEGSAPAPDCADCVEIRIVGLRRFLPDTSLTGTLTSVFSGDGDEFFTTDQVFAVGRVLFSPKTGFFHTFEMGVNTSMLTPASLPGMMRRLSVEVIR
jgi:hypothetical protein